MNRKRVFFLITVCVLVLCIGGIAIYLCSHEDSLKSEDNSAYEETLSGTTSPYTREDIESSNSAYLLDPNFQITPENFPQAMADYFSAPDRLFLDVSTSDLNFTTYKSDKIQVNTEIGEVFAEKTITVTNNTEAIGYVHYDFRNEIGEIIIYCSDGKSYVRLVNFAFSSDIFVINANILKEMNAAITEVLPYTMYYGD